MSKRQGRRYPRGNVRTVSEQFIMYLFLNGNLLISRNENGRVMAAILVRINPGAGQGG
jgi:hypothetical protein